MAALKTILGMRKSYKIRNDEICRRVGFTNTLLHLVYTRKHKWLGHVLRMDDERIDSTKRKGGGY